MRHNEVVMLPINELMDFEAQPFKVLDDDSMYELVESIKNVGVLVPIIVRKQNGRYEIISGHRRKRACVIAGIDTIPATVMELDDDEAAIMLVDSNLQRENLLPSEKAYAYKLKLDAIKHQGKRGDASDDELLLVSSDLVGTESNKSGRQIRRYIRLTELIYPLLDKVDIKIIPVTAGAEVSFLNVKLQVSLNEQIDFYECKLNTHQAKAIKYGKSKGRQRYLCKDCNSTFGDTNGTVAFRSKLSVGKWIELIKLTLQGESCRTIAKELSHSGTQSQYAKLPSILRRNQCAQP